MLKLQANTLCMGIRLSGNAKQLEMLGNAFIQVGVKHPVEAVGQEIAQFGHSLKPSPYKKPTTTHNQRVSWPRLLYLLHILQKLTPPLVEGLIEKQALTILCQRSRAELKKWQVRCRMPISHFVDACLPLYEGDYIEGLLLMSETAFVRHMPIHNRMDFLTTCIDILSPGAWIHYDTLAFVKSIAYDSWSMHILRSDLDYDFSRRRW